MQRRDLTFRIFVSSTFSDLVAERNVLQQDVFRWLRNFCQRNGARFQAVDLRWGVPDEAGFDQQTMNICLEELRRCRTSPRPNFIFLLGQRYGWCPLPWQIDAREFDDLRTCLTDQERQHLLQWYWRDDNADPADYRLQPREGRFQDSAVWEVEEPTLRATLRAAIDRIGWAASDPRRDKYETSATHQEILCALPTNDTHDHVFGFFRTIDGLPQDAKARAYLDYDPQGRPDAEARERLARLQAEMRTQLPGNIHAYSATWSGTAPSADHLKRLRGDVYKRLLWVIRQEIQRRDRANPVDQEAEAHSAFGRDRARHFVGREDSLARIRRYREGDDPHPLVLYGVSGVGKSALMAKAAGLPWEVRGQRPEVVVRYLGATPLSSDLRALLEGLCKEITGRYGGDPSSVPMDVRELEKDFPKRLELAKADRPLVLFLDALDQLGPADGAHRLGWLPTALPPHTKLIVSVLGDQSLQPKAPDSTSGIPSPSANIFETACHLVSADNLVPVSPLTVDDGALLLNAWLVDAHRTLQPPQRQEVLNKFAANGLPLYLKLAFEEARRWPWWGAKAIPSVTTLAADIPGLLGDLFERLEQPQHHGSVLVSYALGYLAASRHGLTEDELLDVLSEDPEVMRDFIQRSVTERNKLPDQRLKTLPLIIWSRLRADIEPYLTERLMHGTTTLAFYHRQIRDFINVSYVPAERKRCLHERLVEYFIKQADPERDGSWRGHLPHSFRELPHHLTILRRWGDIESTFSNIFYIAAQCRIGAIFNFISDCEEATCAGFPTSVALLQRALLPIAAQLLQQPGAALQTLYNHFIWAGLRGATLERSLRLASETLNSERSWLCAEAPLPVVHGSLIRTIPFVSDVPFQSVVENGCSLAVATRAGYVTIYNIADGSITHEREIAVGFINTMSFSADGLRVAYASDAGEIGMEGEQNKLIVRRPAGRIFLTGSKEVIATTSMGSLISWQPSTNITREIDPSLSGLPEFLEASTTGDDVLLVARGISQIVGRYRKRRTGWELSPIPWDMPPILDARISEDGLYLLFAVQDRQLVVRDASSGETIALRYELISEPEIRGAPMKCTFGRGCWRGWAFLATRVGHLIAWHWLSGEVKRLADYCTRQAPLNLRLLEATADVTVQPPCAQPPGRRS